MFRQRRVPRTSVNRPIGEDRRLAVVHLRLDDVRTAGRAHGGTVNDALVSVVAGGYRALLLHRGEEVDAVVLRASVRCRSTPPVATIGWRTPTG